MSDSGRKHPQIHTRQQGSAVTIRPSNADDDARVFRLNLDLAAEVMPRAERAQQLDMVCRLLDTVAPEDNLTFVAEADGEVVGIARGILVAQPPHRRAFPGRAGYVDEIYVIPGHRKQGISQKLLRAILSGFRGRGVTYIYTHPATSLVGALCVSQGACRLETYHLSWPSIP